MVWPPPTSTQQSTRHALGRSVLHHQIQTLPRIKYHLWQNLETDACKLWPVLKDNVFVLLTITSICVEHSECPDRICISPGRAFR
jgi:hypothetical protein